MNGQKAQGNTFSKMSGSGSVSNAWHLDPMTEIESTATKLKCLQNNKLLTWVMVILV